MFLVPVVQASLQVELNPVSPLYFQKGTSAQLDISLRHVSGFSVPAKSVTGCLELPDGFIEDSLHTQTRSLLFGSIHSGEGGHYCLKITAEDTVVPGTYHAKLVYWGKNVQTQELDIELIVNPS